MTQNIENADNPETPINPEKQIEDIQSSLSKVESRISDLERLAVLREELNPGMVENTKESSELDNLKKEALKMQEQKEDAERLQDLEMILNELNKLPHTELKIIIETGKTSDGKELQSKHGKVDLEVAKSLAKAAENGVTKLTKAFLTTILGIVKGVIKGIFAAIKEVSGASQR